MIPCMGRECLMRRQCVRSVMYDATAVKVPTASLGVTGDGNVLRALRVVGEKMQKW